MNIYKTSDSIEQLANEVCIFVAAAAVQKMQPWDAAKVLDAIDIINAGGILAAMEPENAARIIQRLNPILSEAIFDDMGEPWEQAIKACIAAA